MFNIATLQYLKQVTGQPGSIAWGNRFISWREEQQSRVLGQENRVAILAIDGSIQRIFQSHTRGVAFANNLCLKTRQSLFFYQGRHCRSARMVCFAVCFYFCLFLMCVFLSRREKIAQSCLPCVWRQAGEQGHVRDLETCWGQSAETVMGIWGTGGLSFLLRWEPINCQDCTRHSGPYCLPGLGWQNDFTLPTNSREC